MIEVDLYQKIRYLHEHEGMSQRAISKLLGISRNTVKKYCRGTHVPWERQGKSGRKRYVITHEVLEFINECLSSDTTENIKKQKHTARRIYHRLVEEKGFKGGESTIREVVNKLRDKPGKVFVPLSFEPGEAFQVDWGQATIYLSDKKLIVHLLCMRECYSADIYCFAFFRPNEESFLEGLIAGFEFFGGVSKRIIFDNAKVAVKEGFGAHAIVQERYKFLAAHYAFQCDFCNIAAGHEKGLVEGLVGWIRRNILVPIPRVETIDDLNVEIKKRCLLYRQHKIAGRERLVGEMAHEARGMMTPLPPYRFDSSKTIYSKVDSFSTVRFDYNHYSVPADYAGKDVSIKGFGNEIIILYRNKEIARYFRCYQRGETLYRMEHYLDLIEKRPRSVFNAKPVKSNVSNKLIEIGKRLSGPREMVKLLRLFVDYGEEKLMEVISYIRTPEITIEQVQAHLLPANKTVEVSQEIEVNVATPQINKYDTLINRGA